MPDSRFGRSRRLLTAQDFSAVFATRRLVKGKIFALHYRTKAVGEARLGLAIAKRQARKATVRNAIKRVARDLFRQSLASRAPFDLILRLAQPVATVGKGQESKLWREDIERLLGLLPGTKSVSSS